MDDVRPRLMTCFSAVFPELPRSEIVSATATAIPLWDSVASVTLFATVEEEFGIEIDVNKMADLLSFQKLEEYLREHTNHRSD
jgi:acyl carrier protein